MRKDREVVIKETHRGLWYENGVLTQVLGAGRYRLPRQRRLRLRRRPAVQLTLVDVRERDLLITGQEILTTDKVAIRVSTLAQFRVLDPEAALHQVENYHDRLQSDLQSSTRRCLAGLSLDEILAQRNRLGEEILAEAREAAAGYGVTLSRADIRDLVFPGNLQELMNRVLAAERMAQAQLVEARTRAEVQRIQAEAGAQAERMEAEVRTQAQRLEAENEACVRQIRTQAEIEVLQRREEAARAYATHPALLRLEELEALRDLAGGGRTQVHVNFDRQAGDRGL